MARKTQYGLFDIDGTFESTYSTLRWAMVIFAAAFPLLLWWGGELFGISRQDSISDYYYTDFRGVFVGGLCAMAAWLFAYKGMSDRENTLLNLASIFAIATALVPDQWPQSQRFKPHAVFAVAFFLMIALACWLCPNDSLRLGLVPDKDKLRYRMKYTLTGVALLALPLMALIFDTAFVRKLTWSAVFWIESVAIWVFAFYWANKSGELAVAARREMRMRQRGIE